MPLRHQEWFVPTGSTNGQDCVETRFTGDAVHVRNSRRPEADVVVFTHREWEVFVAGVKDGDYDL